MELGHLEMGMGTLERHGKGPGLGWGCQRWQRRGQSWNRVAGGMLGDGIGTCGRGRGRDLGRGQDWDGDAGGSRGEDGAGMRPWWDMGKGQSWDGDTAGPRGGDGFGMLVLAPPALPAWPAASWLCSAGSTP